MTVRGKPGLDAIHLLLPTTTTTHALAGIALTTLKTLWTRFEYANAQLEYMCSGRLSSHRLGNCSTPAGEVGRPELPPGAPCWPPTLRNRASNTYLKFRMGINAVSLEKKGILRSLQ